MALIRCVRTTFPGCSESRKKHVWKRGTADDQLLCFTNFPQAPEAQRSIENINQFPRFSAVLLQFFFGEYSRMPLTFSDKLHRTEFILDSSFPRLILSIRLLFDLSWVPRPLLFHLCISFQLTNLQESSLSGPMGRFGFLLSFLLVKATFNQRVRDSLVHWSLFPFQSSRPEGHTYLCFQCFESGFLIMEDIGFPISKTPCLIHGEKLANGITFSVLNSIE